MSRRHDAPGWLRKAASAARDSPALVALAVVGILAVVMLVGFSVLDRRDAEQTQVALDQTAARARTLAEEIRGECATGQLHGPVCEQADDVARTPVPAPVPVAAQVRPTAQEIDAAVTAYLVAHPPPAGRPPSEVEVAAAVTQYLTANPPDPGRPPTPEEITAAVELYFDEHPVPPGDPGRPPTPEEIRAAVAAELAANPPPPGPQGPTGPTGPAGPAGPSCPPGTTLQQVTYGGGLVGMGCVFDEQPTPPTTTPSPPVLSTDLPPPS